MRPIFKPALEALETAAQESGEFDVAYADEAGFALGTVIPYAWQAVGETLELPAKDAASRRNVFGIFNRQNRLYAIVFEGPSTSEIVVACLADYSLGLVTAGFI